MSRKQLIGLAALAGAPLLVLTLAVAGFPSFGRSSYFLALWFVCILLAAEILWRRIVGDSVNAGPEPEVARSPDRGFEIRDMQDRLRTCEAERDRIAGLLEDLTQSLGEGLIVVDADLNVRLINPVARHFCSARNDDSGKHLLEVISEPEVHDAMKSAAIGEKPDPVLVRNPRGLWELKAFPIRDGGAVVLVADVGLIRRSADLRRRFVQDLSHELRSPLAVLRTTVEAVEDEVEPRLAEILVRQIERLDRLTVELYELATIEAGQMILNPLNIRVESVVREVIQDLAPDAERDGVTVVAEDLNEVELNCDRRALYRVITNLVDNAIKYNRKGGRVEISAFVDDEGRVVEVRDTGEGIPATELQAVSQRFYRVNRARTPGRGGLGLGLAIVKHLVKHMGAQLDLSSREGVGTTIRVVFPVQDSSEAT